MTNTPNYFGWLHRYTRDHRAGQYLTAVIREEAQALLRLNPGTTDLTAATEVNESIDEVVSRVIETCETERLAIHYLLVLVGQQNEKLAVAKPALRADLWVPCCDHCGCTPEYEHNGHDDTCKHGCNDNNLGVK